MTETIKQMLTTARHNMKKTSYLRHYLKNLALRHEYWKGRVEALEDALKAIKIESDWCKN